MLRLRTLRLGRVPRLTRLESDIGGPTRRLTDPASFVEGAGDSVAFAIAPIVGQEPPEPELRDKSTTVDGSGYALKRLLSLRAFPHSEVGIQ